MTCDAWQASNADAYFAVTGHWIEEAIKNKWVLQSALFGFTHMNTAHNSKRLGQALFKICLRLSIIEKVRNYLMINVIQLTMLQIGKVTSDNAANNITMMGESSKRYEGKVGKPYDVKQAHIR